MKPHQRSPQFFVTLRLLEVLTTNTPGSGLGCFLPQTGALVFPPCSQTLPCCEMLPRSTFACFPSCCSLPIPSGMCPVPACPGSLGCHEPPGRFMTSKEGGCCCSSWGKWRLGGERKAGRGGMWYKVGAELGWVRLGWVRLGSGHLEQRISPCLCPHCRQKSPSWQKFMVVVTLSPCSALSLFI